MNQSMLSLVLNEYSTITFSIRAIEGDPKDGLLTIGIEKDVLSRIIRKGMAGNIKINGSAEIKGRVQSVHSLKDGVQLSFERKDAL